MRKVKTWACGRSIAGSNPTGVMDVGDLCVLCVCVCCQVEVSASGRSFVYWSRIECGVSECGRKAPIMRRPWSIRSCCSVGEQRKNCVWRTSPKVTEKPLIGLNAFKKASEHDTFPSQDPRNFMFKSKFPEVAASRFQDKCTY